MIEVTKTFSAKCKTLAEYKKIEAKIESEATQMEGWQIVKEPLILKISASKTDEVEVN